MKNVLISVIIAFGCMFTTLAQQPSDKALTDAASRGTSLEVNTVNSSVSAEAVLIPYNDARRIFGREIAKNYAVIELNIGNKSPDAAIIVQGVFINYERWALSGIPHGQAKLLPEPSRFDPYQTASDSGHVASSEYRVVRGQLLDAQNSSWRNRVMNWLTLAGSLAGAYTFSLNETGIIKGITQATSVGIPGLKTALADPTIEQLNRISDFGFRSGKSIPRQGSDVIVCFFPIDRFLTPGFKQLYLKSPALFFAPLEMVVDRTIQKDVERVLGAELGLPITLDVLRQKLPCFLKLRLPVNPDDEMKDIARQRCLAEFGLEEQPVDRHALAVDQDTPPDANSIAQTKKLVAKGDEDSRKAFDLFIVLDYIGQTSLNSINVTVDGVMTLDTSAFSAKIETLAFNDVDGCGDDKTSCFWTDIGKKDGVRGGIISGSYETGGTVSIAEADKLGITKLTTEASTDQELKFSYKLTKPVPPGSKLTFVVVKTQPGPNGTNSKALKGTPKEYTVTYTLKDPSIDDKSPEINYGATPISVTVKGKNFFNPADDKDPKVTLQTPSGKEVSPKLTSTADGQLVFEIPPDTKPVGCWTVRVKVAGKEVTKKFEIAPTIANLAIQGTGDNKKLIINGTDLDATDCQATAAKLQIQLQKDLQLVDLALPADMTDKKITIPLKGKASDADNTWTIHIRFGGNEVNTFPQKLPAPTP